MRIDVRNVYGDVQKTFYVGSRDYHCVHVLRGPCQLHLAFFYLLFLIYPSIMSGFECLIGIKCNDFILLAHDNFAGRSILVMKQTQDKLFRLGDHLGMVVCGDSGDTVYFGEYIQKNLALYRIRNGYALSPHASANFTRYEMAKRLREKPNLVNLIMGGFDPSSKKVSLYYMDYLGALADVFYTAHGYGSLFVLSILDRFYRPDMTKEEVEELLKKCITVVQERLAINLPSFSYYFVDETGFSERNCFTVQPAKKCTIGKAGDDAAMETEVFEK